LIKRSLLAGTKLGGTICRICQGLPQRIFCGKLQQTVRADYEGPNCQGVLLDQGVDLLCSWALMLPQKNLRRLKGSLDLAAQICCGVFGGPDLLLHLVCDNAAICIV
jgi:hypothetical protein